MMELNPGGKATSDGALVVADWMADPQAVVAVCAERQHANISHLARAVGFSFDTAKVGGPDPLAAICTRSFAAPGG
jgi:hypothetical protein